MTAIVPPGWLGIYIVERIHIMSPLGCIQQATRLTPRL